MTAKTERISVRVTEKEKQIIDQKAADEHRTTSDYIRVLLIESTNEEPSETQQ